MGLNQLILLIAFFAISIVGVNAEVPETLLFSDNGCLTYVDHNAFDEANWACGAHGTYMGGHVSVKDDKYKITIYTGFQGGKNPPKMSKPQVMQTFEWSGYQGDVSAPENTCLHTLAKPGEKSRQIGSCTPRVYEGPAMSNPYWRKMDFFKQYSDFQTSNDSGMDSLASIEIASPDIASAEIVSTEINPAETAESVAGHLFPADAGLNQPVPVPLAGLTYPGPSSPGPEYFDFNVKRK